MPASREGDRSLRNMLEWERVCWWWFGGLWWLGLDGDFFFQVFENDGDGWNAILNFSLLARKIMPADFGFAAEMGLAIPN